MDPQIESWFSTIQNLAENHRNGKPVAEKLKDVLQETFIFHSKECFSLQQLLIFNIDSICTKSESANNKSILIKELLTQSLICQALLLDPLFEEEPNISSPWLQIRSSLNIIKNNIRTFSGRTLETIMANLSTLCLIDQQPNYLDDLIEFKQEIHERCIFSKNEESKLVNQLIHRFFGLQKVTNIEHIEDVYQLNIFLIKIKFTPHNVTEQDFENILQRNGLQELESLINYARVLYCKSTADNVYLSKYTNLILEPGNESLEVVRTETMLLKGYDLLLAGCHQLALAAFYQALKDCPTSLRGMIGTSEALKLSGNTRSAIEILKNAVKLKYLNNQRKENNTYIISVLKTLSSHKEDDCHYIVTQLANLQMMNEEFSETVSSVLLSLKDPGSQNYPPIILQKLRLAASFSLLVAGNPKESLVIAQFMNSKKISLYSNNKRKIETEPFELLVNFILAKCYYALDQSTRALSFFDKALRVIVPSVDTSAGKVRAGLNKNSKNVMVEFNMETYSKIRSRLYYEKSVVYKRTGDRKSCKQSLEAAVSLNPSDFILQYYANYLDEIRDSQKEEKVNCILDNIDKDTMMLDMANLDVIPICIKYIIEHKF